MREVDGIWRQAQEELFINNAKVNIRIGRNQSPVIGIEINENEIPLHTNSANLRDITITDNSTMIRNTISDGALEINRFLLDGSMGVFNPNAENIGNVLSADITPDFSDNSDNWWEWQWDNLVDIGAIIIDFDETREEFARTLQVDMQTANGWEMLLEDGSENLTNDSVRKVIIIPKEITGFRIKINEWSIPERRVRISKVSIGLNLAWSSNEVLNYSYRGTADRISRSLPSESIEFTVRDSAGIFNPISPSNVTRLVDSHLEILVSYAFGNSNEVPIGNFIFNEVNFNFNNFEATISGMDRLQTLGDSEVDFTMPESGYISELISLTSIPHNILTKSDESDKLPADMIVSFHNVLNFNESNLIEASLLTLSETTVFNAEGALEIGRETAWLKGDYVITTRKQFNTVNSNLNRGVRSIHLRNSLPGGDLDTIGEPQSLNNQQSGGMENHKFETNIGSWNNIILTVTGSHPRGTSIHPANVNHRKPQPFIEDPEFGGGGDGGWNPPPPQARTDWTASASRLISRTGYLTTTYTLPDIWSNNGFRIREVRNISMVGVTAGAGNFSTQAIIEANNEQSIVFRVHRSNYNQSRQTSFVATGSQSPIDHTNHVLDMQRGSMAMATTPNLTNIPSAVSFNLILSQEAGLYRILNKGTARVTLEGNLVAHIRQVNHILDNAVKWLSRRVMMEINCRIDPRLELLDDIEVETPYGIKRITVTEIDLRFNGQFTGIIRGLLHEETDIEGEG